MQEEDENVGHPGILSDLKNTLNSLRFGIRHPQVRSEIVPVRMTRKERAELEETAKHRGISVSDWIRTAALQSSSDQ